MKSAFPFFFLSKISGLKEKKKTESGLFDFVLISVYKICRLDRIVAGIDGWRGE